MQAVDEVSSTQLSDKSVGIIYFCTHPEIVTLGRKTKPEDLFAWSGKALKVSRGGRATYHGPSQLVVYPIINLKKLSPAQDVGFFIRNLENIFVELIRGFGLPAVGKSFQKSEPTSEEPATGVWVNDKKVASLGLAIKNWTTYHGVALNLEADANAFKGLNPCGYQSTVMTNLQDLLAKKSESKMPNRTLIINQLKILFEKYFRYGISPQ